MNSYERELERERQQQYAQIMKRFTGPLLLAGAACLFGALPAIQQTSFDYIPPWTFLWIRYVIALITLGLFVSISARSSGQSEKHTKPWSIREHVSPFSTLVSIAFTGFFATAGALIVGSHVINQPSGSLLLACLPIFLFVFGIAFLKERLEAKKITAIGIALLGAVVFVLKDGRELLDFGPTSQVSEGWILLSGILWAFQAVTIKRYTKEDSPLLLTFYSFVIALVLITPLMIIELYKQGKILSIWTDLFSSDLPQTMTVLFVGVFTTAAAYYMWVRGVQLTHLSTGCVVMNLQLIVNEVVRWFLREEDLSTSFFIGGIVLIISMYWMFLEKDDKKQTSEE